MVRRRERCAIASAPPRAAAIGAAPGATLRASARNPGGSGPARAPRTALSRPSGPPDRRTSGLPNYSPHEPPPRVLQPTHPPHQRLPSEQPLHDLRRLHPRRSEPFDLPDHLLVPRRLGPEPRRSIAHRSSMRVEKQPRLQRRRPPKTGHQCPRRFITLVRDSNPHAEEEIARHENPPLRIPHGEMVGAVPRRRA